MNSKMNVFDLAKNAMSIIVMLMGWVFLFLNWGRIPDILPISYGLTEMTNDAILRDEVMVLPILGVVLWIFFYFIEQYPNIWTMATRMTKNKKFKLYQLIRSMMITLKLLVTAMISFLCVSIVSLTSYPNLTIYVSLVLLFTMAYYFLRMLLIK